MALIFVTFIYCGGMPTLLAFLLIFLIVTYWVDKIMILRFYKLPPKFSAEIHMRVMAIVPWAIFMHMAFSMWFYGAPDIFPQ